MNEYRNRRNEIAPEIMRICAKNGFNEKICSRTRKTDGLSHKNNSSR